VLDRALDLRPNALPFAVAVVGDAGEQVGEIKLRIEAVEFGAFDQRGVITPNG